MTTGNTRGRVTGLVFNPWNLLLIVPFIILLTPIYNLKSPEFIGMPFFYWFQMLFIAVGVASTIIVYRMTRKSPVGEATGEEPDVDSLDEGSAD
jgi:predicted ferric reductase